MADITLEAGWKSRLAPVLASEGMARLRQFLVEEKQAGKVIYPKGCHYFQAMNLTPFEAVKVVILGQDPYHGAGQAHGLSFSVQPGIAVPPSLVNIYKELESDLGTTPVEHGCLVPWARQGVLLLNTVLTVEANKAASHRGPGLGGLHTTRSSSSSMITGNSWFFILWGQPCPGKGPLHRQPAPLCHRVSASFSLVGLQGLLGQPSFFAAPMPSWQRARPAAHRLAAGGSARDSRSCRCRVKAARKTAVWPPERPLPAALRQIRSRRCHGACQLAALAELFFCRPDSRPGLLLRGLCLHGRHQCPCLLCAGWNWRETVPERRHCAPGFKPHRLAQFLEALQILLARAQQLVTVCQKLTDPVLACVLALCPALAPSDIPYDFLGPDRTAA